MCYPQVVIPVTRLNFGMPNQLYKEICIMNTFKVEVLQKVGMRNDTSASKEINLLMSGI